MTTLYVKSINITNMTYQNCTVLTDLNLNYCPIRDDSYKDGLRGCSNLRNVTNIHKNVSSIWRCFNGCSNLMEAPNFSECQQLTNAYLAFEDAHNMVSAPNFYNCNALTNANGMFFNCISMEYAPNIVNCNNITDVNGMFCYCQSMKNAPYIDGCDKITNMTNMFRNCQSMIEAPEMGNMSGVVNMTNAFADCIKMESVNTLPPNVEIMNFTFGGYSIISNGCKSLINAPVIPNSVKQMNSCFSNCQSLLNTPVIPDSVINMQNCFVDCHNLKTVLEIGNGVTNMSNTFINCYNLSNITEIGNSVTNMYRTFSNCYNLSNTILIWSENISNAYQCFQYSNLSKNVYIPMTYENGVNTLTYETLNTIYGTGINGVTLKDIDIYTNVTPWTYITEENGIRTLCNYIDLDTDVIIPLYKTQLNNYSAQSNLFYGKTSINSIDMGYINVVDNNLSYAFYGCSGLTEVSQIPNSIINYSHTFDGCDNFVQDVFLSNEIINAIDMYNNTTNTKNVYINYVYKNGENTTSYNSFDTAGYTSSRNGVNLVDYQEYKLGDWTYTTLENGIRLLRYYNGTDTNVSVPYANTMINDYRSGTTSTSNAPFYSNKSIISVDLQHRPFGNNSLFKGFYQASNVKSVINVNENIINMSNAFYSCYNLREVFEIPSSVVDMSNAFYWCNNISSISGIPDTVNNITNIFSRCSNLVNAPAISKNITSMNGAFYMCSNLVNAPDMSNATNVTSLKSVFDYCSNLITLPDLSNCSELISMESTFGRCYNLTSAPVIPSTVINISGIFSQCVNLRSTPVIPSSVTSMTSAFYQCSNIVDAPVIPYSVTSLQQTFSGCSNIVIAPDIGDNVINMDYTFDSCSKLTTINRFSNNTNSMCNTFINCLLLNNIPEIPYHVSNMYQTFRNCKALTGNIIIRSKLVENASYCFNSTTLEKNVYIPFTYDVSEDMYAYGTSAGYYVNCYFNSTNPQIGDTAYDLDFNDNGVIVSDIISSYFSLSNGIQVSRCSSSKDVPVGAYTKTYNTFINAGYDTLGTKEGVTLRDITTL